MSVIIFKKFLNESQCDELNNWITQGPLTGKLKPGPDGNNVTDYSLELKTRLSTRMMLKSDILYPPIAYQTQTKIISICKLQNLHISIRGVYGIIVNRTQPGGDCWKHLDPTETQRITKNYNIDVLQCNIVTQQSEHGGELFVDGEKRDLNPGDLHCYIATKYPHYVTKNKGTVDRICWLFGFQLPTSDPRFLQWI